MIKWNNNNNITIYAQSPISVNQYTPSYFIARMNRLHKHFNSISTRVECFFNSKSKPIESQDYPKNHNFGNLLFEFQWCYIIYSVDGLAQKYNEHENRCTYKTDLEWMPYINRNRLTDRHEIERVCVCVCVPINRKWHKNSMNFYWTWNPINHTSKILRVWKKASRCINSNRSSMKWILLCIGPFRSDWETTVPRWEYTVKLI